MERSCKVSDRDYTYPALRLIQVLPGLPLADQAGLLQCRHQGGEGTEANGSPAPRAPTPGVRTDLRHPHPPTHTQPGRHSHPPAHRPPPLPST